MGARNCAQYSRKTASKRPLMTEKRPPVLPSLTRISIRLLSVADLKCQHVANAQPGDLAQSTVSQHLKVLKECGLIRGDVDGPRVCYCIEPRALRRLKALIASL
jgi:ArsR family transcriptional regulator